MITIQWVVYMVVACCVCFGILFLLYFFITKRVVKAKGDLHMAHLDKIEYLERNKKEDGREIE